MSLDYEKIIAEPDSDSFFDCILRHNPQLNTTSTNGEPKMKILQEMWHTAAQAATIRGRYDILQTHVQDLDPNLMEINNVRMCARSQTLRVDAEKVAVRLLQLSHTACKSRERR